MKNPTPVRYRNLIWRIIAAFTAVSYLMLHGQTVSLFHMLHLPLFYIDFGESLAIAFILISWTHLFTLLLDRRLPWESNLPGRAVLQVILCWLLPCFVAYFLADLYFAAQHIDIEKTDYASREIQVVATMLGAMNIYYYFHYLYLRLKNENTKLKEENQKLKGLYLGLLNNDNLHHNSLQVHPDEILHLTFNGQSLNLNAIKDVAYIYSNGGNWVQPKKGKRYNTDDKLKEMESRLNGNGFFRINKRCIINKEIIDHYEPGGRNGTYRIRIKDEYDELKVEEDNLFFVSEKYAVRFVAWMQSANHSSPAFDS